MDKDKQKPKREHPRSYSKEVIEKVLTLIKEGKNLKEILSQVPCKRAAVRRYARKANLTIKK